MAGREVTTELVVRAFVVGGLLGILGASLLENYLENPSAWLFSGVGLIEEGVKLLALLLVTRRMRRRDPRDGMILGAAVGFGFASFETAGYAFNAVLTVEGLSVSALVQTELLRGVLAPVGHGLWTAILGGVMFAALSRRRGHVHRRFSGIRLVLMYLWVSLLHALWDASHELALMMTYLITETIEEYDKLVHGYLSTPTATQATLFGVLSIGALVVVAILGLVTLLVEARSVARVPRAPAAPGSPAATPATG